MDRKDLVWKEVHTEHIIQDRWMDLRRSTYRFPDGTEFEPYYTYSRRDYAVIVATDQEGRCICVRQFRPGINSVTTEFPAGGLERPDGKEYGAARNDAEDALSAAKRELLEETGYVSDQWTHLLTIPSHATISDNNAYIFQALSCRKVSEQHLDDTEFLNVELHTPQELEDMIYSGRFQQAVHVLGWLLSKERKT